MNTAVIAMTAGCMIINTNLSLNSFLNSWC